MSPWLIKIVTSDILFTYLQTLLDAAVDFQYPLAGTSKEAEQKVRDVWEKEDYARYGEIVQDIVILWGDPSIQKCIEQKAKIQVSPFKLTPHVDMYLPSSSTQLRIS